MSRQRNWTAVGLGVEVLAAVAILISPWLAIPIAFGGAGIIAWGLYPEKIERVISRVLPSRIPNPEASQTLKPEQEGPVYWSLAETLSWVAFGEAITAKGWTKKCISGGLLVRPQEETDSFNKAEHLLFEALRGEKICALGKKNESQQYEEIPPEYFLSDVSCAILHNQIDVNPENIGARSKWDGPKWYDVRFKREVVLLLWPQGKEGKVELDEIGIRFDSWDSEALADFLFSADELIKRIVSSNDDLNKWKQDYQEWNTNVTNFIRDNISHTQAYYFSNPGMVVVRQFDGAYNDEHNSLLNSLAVQRENLRHLHSLES